MSLATSVSIATTVITALIAALVCVITWRQWVTNRARLRHELFDLRYAIFEQIASFMVTVNQNGKAEPGAAERFLRQTKRAYFAFGCDKNIRQLVDDIYNQATLLQVLQQSQDVPAGNASNQNADRLNTILQWFNTTFDSLEQRFEMYLRLDH